MSVFDIYRCTSYGQASIVWIITIVLELLVFIINLEHMYNWTLDTYFKRMSLLQLKLLTILFAGIS